jgi:Na+-transporting NADH:ubiquinone oxidoreductase subunit NqrE
MFKGYLKSIKYLFVISKIVYIFHMLLDKHIPKKNLVAKYKKYMDIVSCSKNN